MSIKKKTDNKKNNYLCLPLPNKSSAGSTCSFSKLHLIDASFHRRLQGGAGGPCLPPPKGQRKIKELPILHHFALSKKFPSRKAPRPHPPKLLISPALLALTAAGPLQSKRLEPPLNSSDTKASVFKCLFLCRISCIL